MDEQQRDRERHITKPITVYKLEAPEELFAFPKEHWAHLRFEGWRKVRFSNLWITVKKTRMSLEDVSVATGWSITSLEKMKTGKGSYRIATPDALKKMADDLGVPLVRLVTGKKKKRGAYPRPLPAPMVVVKRQLYTGEFFLNHSSHRFAVWADTEKEVMEKLKQHLTITDGINITYCTTNVDGVWVQGI